LHRPVQRKDIYVTKLLIGLVTYLACGAAPILLYACWAATPGTHASPFDWSMTVPVWNTWLACATVYLGAFLAGLRPGAWVGTRLTPVAASICIAGVAEFATWVFGMSWSAAYPLVLIVADIGLVAAILYTAEARDFG